MFQRQRDDSGPERAFGRQWAQTLSQGVSLLEELLEARVAEGVELRADALLCLCHLLGFRARTASALPVIGILGSANSGKSTLFNSIARADIARVTPIPHQTTGPILAGPRGFEKAALDPSFLRPVSQKVEWTDEAAGLSGDSTFATVVPAWDGPDAPFVLMDLPDIGTVDSKEERQVALRMLPWLDRVILLATEESFAQAEHENIERRLHMLRPERARAELYVVLNRRHARTADAEFQGRLETLRSLWPEAVISTLGHLDNADRFPLEQIESLTAEARARVSRILASALRNLAVETSEEVSLLVRERQSKRRILEQEIDREIESAGRFRKAFFSDEFKARLDAFSPWQMSVKRLRSMMGKPQTEQPAAVELLAEAPVQRHVLRTAQQVRKQVKKHLERVLDGGAATEPLRIPEPDENAIRSEVAEVVAGTNRRARKDVESLLESMQEQRKVKDPLWSLTAAVASTLFLVDLFLPGVGTVGTLTVSGILSALGLGGVLLGSGSTVAHQPASRIL